MFPLSDERIPENGYADGLKNIICWNPDEVDGVLGFVSVNWIVVAYDRPDITKSVKRKTNIRFRFMSPSI